MRRARSLVGATMVALTSVCSAAAGQNADEAAALAKPISCDQLTTEALGLSDVKIVSASATPADKGLPAACVVRGLADERTGVDGRRYGLDFEMRLPATWNGRLLHQVNGGNDGEVVAAIGDPHELNAYGGKPALAR